MKGKFTGALCLIGFGVLLKKPDLHDALNRLVEARFRSLADWIGAILPRGSQPQIEQTSGVAPADEAAPPKKRPRRKSPGKSPGGVARRSASKAKRVAAGEG